MPIRLNTQLRRILAGFVIVLATGLSGCVTTVPSDARYYGRADVRYDYYYYPTADIYLDIASGYYWYHDHDRWARVRHLPPHYRLHDHDRVFLRLDTDRPYRYAVQHRDRYRAQPARTTEHRVRNRDGARERSWDKRVTGRQHERESARQARADRSRQALRMDEHRPLQVQRDKRRDQAAGARGQTAGARDGRSSRNRSPQARRSDGHTQVILQSNDRRDHAVDVQGHERRRRAAAVDNGRPRQVLRADQQRDRSLQRGERRNETTAAQRSDVRGGNSKGETRPRLARQRDGARDNESAPGATRRGGWWQQRGGRDRPSGD